MNFRVQILPLLSLLMALAACGQSDGSYEIVWSTIDGGGGTSSGGPYVLTGTIGQPDAGYSASGDAKVVFSVRNLVVVTVKNHRLMPRYARPAPRDWVFS